MALALTSPPPPSKARLGAKKIQKKTAVLSGGAPWTLRIKPEGRNKKCGPTGGRSLNKASHYTRVPLNECRLDSSNHCLFYMDGRTTQILPGKWPGLCPQISGRGDTVGGPNFAILKMGPMTIYLPRGGGGMVRPPPQKKN